MVGAMEHHTLQPIDNAFTFLDQEIRTATDQQGVAWFCAKDVFNAMGISLSTHKIFLLS